MKLTIADAADLIRKKALSPVELTSACLERIERLNPKLNAFITVTAESAMATARQAEREIQQGKYRGPLHGIPTSVKDLFYTKGVRTTVADPKLWEFVPKYDATVVSKLKDAGAVMVGKAHLVLGVSRLDSNFGDCRNPWRLDRIAGISSSGGGGTIAASLNLASIGSDAGGSVRWPAACCGVTGLKPTFGRVSRYGSVVLGLSVDNMGPLTWTAQDAALVLQVIAGYDPLDPYSAKEPVPDFSLGLNGSIKGMRVGIPKEHFWNFLDPEVEAAAQRSISALEELGCVVQQVSIPSAEYIAEIGAVISAAEIAAWHMDQLASSPELYPQQLVDRIEAGILVPAKDYIRAQWAKKRLVGEVEHAFESVDLLVSATSSIPAPPVGLMELEHQGKRWVTTTLAARLTSPFNQTGHPAVSVPNGFTTDGLPTGFQFVGRYFQEATVLKVADAYQRVTDWHLRRPSL